MTKKILVLPGWMRGMNFHNGNDIFNIQIGKFSNEDEDAEIVGFSLGALVALRDWNGKGKLILVNPLLPKRNIFAWFFAWVKFIVSEGLFFKHQKFTKNPFKFIIEIVKCVGILSIDFSEKIDNISKDKLVVIRGKNDRFLCDKRVVNFFDSKGLKVIEIESAHNWSKLIENTILKLTK